MDNEKRRITGYKQLDTISEEWNNICEYRDKAIEQGLDVSLEKVTIPCIIREIIEEKPHTIVDVGCGTGYLTNRLVEYAPTVGIDCSKKSIGLAKSKYVREGLSFELSMIENYNPDYKFDVCVANMVFSSDSNWVKSINNIYHILSDNGCIIIVLPHPCFWPQYWNLIDKDWFSYDKEIFIEHDFSITFAKSMGISTYIHRPLETYVNDCIDAGFCIEKIKEPYPFGNVPEGYTYTYPRFLMVKARK